MKELEDLVMPFESAMAYKEDGGPQDTLYSWFGNPTPVYDESGKRIVWVATTLPEDADNRRWRLLNWPNEAKPLCAAPIISTELPESERATKLLKPLVWDDSEPGQWSAKIKLRSFRITEEGLFSIISDGLHYHVDVYLDDRISPIAADVCSIYDAKSAAEEWYTNFVLGFLNLEGGEE